MALPPRTAPAAFPPPVRLRRAGVAYWTPADLGLDNVSIDPGNNIATPVLWCPGLNGFMLLIQFVAFVPGFSLLDITLNIHEPINEAVVLTPALWSIGAAMTPVISFGAFGTELPFSIPTTASLVWWVFSLDVFNAGVNVDTYRVHLFGGTR